MTHLQAVKPSAERIADFCAAEGAAERVGNGWVYDALCGWTLVNAWRAGSIDGSRGFYHYDAPLPGAVDRPRRVVNSRGLPCRIHSFGDSFTHCDQVSDGETWQEFLAGHIQEPVKNFGVGGYSVHHAFTRMERVELGPETSDHRRGAPRGRRRRGAATQPPGLRLGSAAPRSPLAIDETVIFLTLSLHPY